MIEDFYVSEGCAPGELRTGLCTQQNDGGRVSSNSIDTSYLISSDWGHIAIFPSYQLQSHKRLECFFVVGCLTRNDDFLFKSSIRRKSLP